MIFELFLLLLFHFAKNTTPQLPIRFLISVTRLKKNYINIENFFQLIYWHVYIYYGVLSFDHSILTIVIYLTGITVKIFNFSSHFGW